MEATIKMEEEDWAEISLPLQVTNFEQVFLPHVKIKEEPCDAPPELADDADSLKLNAPEVKETNFIPVTTNQDDSALPQLIPCSSNSVSSFAVPRTKSSTTQNPIVTETFSCVLCVEQCKDYQELHTHIKQKHGNFPVCPKCKVIFVTGLLLREHVRAGTCKFRESQRINVLRCKKCLNVLDTELPLHEHVCSILPTLVRESTGNAGPPSLVKKHSREETVVTFDSKQLFSNASSEDKTSVPAVFIDYEASNQSFPSSGNKEEEEEEPIYMFYNGKSMKNTTPDVKYYDTSEVNNIFYNNLDVKSSTCKYIPRILALKNEFKKITTNNTEYISQLTADARKYPTIPPLYYHCVKCVADYSFDDYFNVHLDSCILDTSEDFCSLCCRKFKHSLDKNKFILNKLEHLLCHVKYASKTSTCSICSLTFPLIGNYMRHIGNMHASAATGTISKKIIRRQYPSPFIKINNYKALLQNYLQTVSLKSCKIKLLLGKCNLSKLGNRLYLDEMLNKEIQRIPNFVSQHAKKTSSKTNVDITPPKCLVKKTKPVEFCDELHVYCISCNHVIPVKSYIDSHATLCASKHGNYMCPFCYRDDESTTNCILTHINSHLDFMANLANAFQVHCPVCDLSFINGYNKSHHYRYMHSNPCAFQCKSCDFSLPSLRAVTGHIWDFHVPIKFRERTRLNGPPRPRKNFTCELCGVCCAKKCNVERHIKLVHFPPYN